VQAPCFKLLIPLRMQMRSRLTSAARGTETKNKTISGAERHLRWPLGLGLMITTRHTDFYAQIRHCGE
jgi:hypothetical protein